MKKLIGFSLALIAAFTIGLTYRIQIADAIGSIRPFNVTPELKTVSRVIAFTTLVAGDVTEGTNGVISKVDAFVGSAVVVAPVDTDPDMPPFPCKLDVVCIDGSPDSGDITCTSVVLNGRNQFGESISETISTISETASESAKVYEKVDKVTYAGCAIASDGDTADDCRVTCSGEVGLPMHIDTEAAIIQFCVWDNSETDTLCFESGDITTDLVNESVETDSLIGGAPLLNNDILFLTVRPPAGR